jgi:DNA polymerase-3 subunit delta'
MPETWALAEQWPLPEPIQQELDDKKRKPSQEIRVEPLREAISWAQQTSSRGQGLVMILVPAERMNAISANTLLKTLEEPVGNTRFILICHDEHHLLPTLRSRCQVRSIPRPTEQQGVHFLINHGLSHSEASLSFKLAAGRPQDALAAQTCSFAQPSFYARFPKAVAQGDDSLLEALQDASAYQWIDLLQKLCHDLYLCRVGATPWFFNQADLPENSTSLSLKALNTWHKQLSQAKRQADHPFQAELMRHAFMAQAQHVFTSRA